MGFTVRHMIKETPTREEFLSWLPLSGLDRKRFVNTNGKLYRELGLKDTMGEMDDGELFDLLAANPMLVKRPILVARDFVLVGFKKPEWEARLA